jgi:putative CocE/NonD family hydrolase
MTRKSTVLLLATAATFVLPHLADSAGPHEITVRKDVRAEMRDGVALVADVYRPAAEGEFPVLLQRTPYNREGGEEQARELASHGYIVVVQDTRGRYGSEGEFYPFRHETDDGYDTVEWAAALPGSNGRVGMYGGSYVGATQMLAAIGRPPHLVSINPYVTASEYYDGWTYQSGVFMQWFASSWTTGLAQDTLSRQVRALARSRDWVFHLPVDDYRVLEVPEPQDVAPYYDDWVRHETDDAYWKPWKISDHYEELSIKALHGAGWHDIFLKGSLENFTGLRTSARTAEARAGQRLLVGPWAHAATSDEGKVGGVVFGRQAVVDMTDTIRTWSDWALKGVENEYATDPPVKIFVLGENVWRREEAFPLRRQRLTRYYLHGATGKGEVKGGSLTTEPPATTLPDEYVYDPALPVPTIGGRLCCDNDALPPGPFDQSPNESRDDVLVFSTPPLGGPVEVTGNVTVELYASTSAADTDFTAMLVDVDPSGYARFLTDGIVRARYRSSTEEAEPVVPGRVYLYEIDLWATSNLFEAGHQIRLDVSSSNFPRFSRNLNTGGPSFGARGMVKAEQRIYHDPDHPSALVLPVIPR